MKKILTLLLFSPFVFLNAQTGPGGVGNSSNNVLWLNGDVVTLGTAPNISTWPDQSGNGYNYSQGTLSKQPTRVTFGAFNCARFDGGDLVNSGAMPLINSNTHSQFIVYNGNKANHTGMLFNSSFTQSNQFYRTFRTSSGDIKSWVLNSSGGIVSNSTTNSSSLQIVSSVWNGNAQTFNSFKNGTSIGSQIGANGNPTGNYANSIGAVSNGSYPFNGDIGEVILYNVVLNSAELNIVNNYLSSKFNIAVSTDLYSYEATNRYQVIGIGKEVDGDNTTAQGAGIVEISSATLNNGDYVLLGHDNVSLSTYTNDVPGSINGATRLTRTWRVDVTGSTNTIDVVYDVTGLSLPGTNGYYLLVESNNGIFNDGGVVTYGPFNDIASIVTFTGVSVADGDYITLASASGASIASIKTGNWNSASTWNCSCIPTATDNATITSGHTVSTPVNASIKDITINGTLNTQQISNFNIKGNLVVGATGSFISKTVNFNGTSSQNITNNSATPVSFNTIVINNSNGVNILTGSFYITNSVSVPNGPLNNVGGTVTLKSNSTKTAVAVSTAGGFSGNFIVERYISQRNESWGDLSSPVLNNHLSDWDSDPSQTIPELYMCAVNGVSGNCGGWSSVYYYDVMFQSYIAITDTSYVLAPGAGIELWLADDTAMLYNKTFDSRGTLNYGPVDVSVSDSWNLVGNPYQAWINWSGLTKPTLNSTYYIWNTNNGSYDAKSSGSIPPHQGFWVESVGSGTLSFTENSKSSSASSTFWRNSEQNSVYPSAYNEEMLNSDKEVFSFIEAKLNLLNTTNNYSHDLKIRINELAKDGNDLFDASFLKSKIADAPSITAYNNDNNKQLAIVSFNSQNNEVKIPISMKTNVDGKFKVSAIDFDLFATSYKTIQLKDNKTSIVYDLTNNKEIFVELSSEDDEKRFELKLSNSSNISQSSNLDASVYHNQDNTFIEVFNLNGNKYNVSIHNVLGQKVIDDYLNINDTKLVIPNSALPKGINVITIQSRDQSFIKKLFY